MLALASLHVRMRVVQHPQYSTHTDGTHYSAVCQEAVEAHHHSANVLINHQVLDFV